MQSVPLAIVAALTGISLGSVALAAYAYDRRRIVGAKEIAALLLCTSIYAGAYSIELTRTDLQGMLGAIKLEYLGIPFLSLSWCVFAYRFITGKKLPPQVIAPMFAAALAVIAAVWTNDAHHLYYTRTWVRTDTPFPVLGIERGPFYYFHYAVMQAEILVGMALLVGYAVKSDRYKKGQALMLAAASLFPWIGSVMYLLGLVPWDLDSNPFSAAFSGAAFALAIFKMGVFEIVPAARELALDSLSDGFLVLDKHGRYLDGNESSRRFFGQATLMKGDILPEELPGSAELIALSDKGEGELEYSVRNSEGAELKVSARAFPILRHGKERQGTAILVRDVTETAALLEQLKMYAETDSLTGFLNRRRFFELGELYVQLAGREKLPISVMIADLDHFKHVNDTYGHRAGDTAITKVSEKIRAGLRAVDLVGRYGGEEFGILLSGTDLPGARFTAERIRKETEELTLDCAGSMLKVTISIGAYTAVPQRGEKLEDLLNLADEALYEAKKTGRNRAVCRSR